MKTVRKKNTLVYDVTWIACRRKSAVNLTLMRLRLSAPAGDTAAVFAYEEQQAFTKALDNAKKRCMPVEPPEQEVLGGQQHPLYMERGRRNGHVTKTMVLSWMEDADHSL